jgi:hypothetical protein
MERIVEKLKMEQLLDEAQMTPEEISERDEYLGNAEYK